MSEGNKTIPELSSESETVYKALSELKEGDELSYEALSAMIGGQDIRKRKAHCLKTARRKCLNDGVLIACVFGVGVRRLKNETVHTVADDTHKRIRNRLRFTKKALDCCNFNRLSGEDKVVHVSKLAFVGTLGLFVKPKAIDKIKANIGKPVSSGFDLADTLKLFAPKNHLTVDFREKAGVSNRTPITEVSPG